MQVDFAVFKFLEKVRNSDIDIIWRNGKRRLLMGQHIVSGKQNSLFQGGSHKVFCYTSQQYFSLNLKKENLLKIITL